MTNWKRCTTAWTIVAALMCARGAEAASYAAPPTLPAPTGVVVNVSTEAQLQNAVGNAAANSTIVVAPGTYNLTSTLYLRVNGVTLRGATNNRDDVVLVGKGMTNSNYGSVPFGIWTDAQGITVANLTVRDIYQHPIMLNAGAQSPRIYNVHLINAGQQFIKANPNGSGSGVDTGIVEYSVIEYQTTSRDDYTNGVDVHTGKGWFVRNNLFRNITAPSGMLAGPAVLMWNGSSGAIVEGNTFVNCQREISMGLSDRTPDDNAGGIVRNNFIYRPSGMYADAAILVADSASTQVLHNTILLNGTYPNAIEYRFAGSRNVTIANNLTSAAIQARDGATGTASANYLKATASMFVGAASGDLHLVASATAVIDKVAAVAGAATDWDNQPRPQGSAADYGADEFASTSTPPPPANQAPSVNLTSPASGSTFTAPAAVALSASATDTDGSIAKVSFYNGSTLLGSDTSSPYTFAWANVAAGTYTLTAAATDNSGSSTTSTPVSITVGATGTTIPAPWATADIGSPAVGGTAAYTTGSFTVTGGGVDVWGTTDQFRFVYQPMNGDGQIIARVATLTGQDAWAKAGVMIREQLTAAARNAFVLVSAQNGLSFQRRLTSAGNSVSTSGISGAAPYWLKLVRAGSTFTASRSTNGSTWTVIGSDTIAMGSAVYVGLAVTAHSPSASAQASITNVAVTAGATNAAPTVSLTSPVNGAQTMATASVTLAATAVDSDGSIARVDFYSGATLIGSDTSSPYAYTWPSVAAGTYSITARAVDDSGNTTTSNAATLTVAASGSSTRTLTFTPSADNDTNVTSYTVEIFPAGANTGTATPAKASNIGKPAAVSGSIAVDLSALTSPLAAGSYFASVKAIGPGGATRSAPSATFAK